VVKEAAAAELLERRTAQLLREEPIQPLEEAHGTLSRWNLRARLR
jgi:hypothetical protein